MQAIQDEAETLQHTSIHSLPIDVLHKIGQELAPNGKSVKSIKSHAWNDGATTAAAAAACIISNKACQHIGMAAYKALLGGDTDVDMSVIPNMVTQRSTVKQLKAALVKWRLVRTGNKTDMWARLMNAYSPSCPIPRNMRHRNSFSRAPVRDYLASDENTRGLSKIIDLHAESLKRFGSLQGWTLAFAQRVKEQMFFTVHCQPHYDNAVRRHVDEWEDNQDSYYNGGGGGGDYWRQRERLRDGYNDSDDEREEVAKEARVEAKPEALRSWVDAFKGGPRCAIKSPHLSDSLLAQLCSSLAAEELNEWIAKNALPMFDDITYLSAGQKKDEIVAFARKLFFTRIKTDKIRNSDELNEVCSAACFKTLYDDIVAWSSHMHEAHKYASSALTSEFPTLIDLYPSLVKLLEARVGDTICKDRDDMLERNKVQTKQQIQLGRDVRAMEGQQYDGCNRMCAMCYPYSMRTFDGKGLRSHAQDKHGLVVSKVVITNQASFNFVLP